MAVPMPAIVILFVCRVVIAGPADQNAGYTGSENLAWDYTNSIMHCKRVEVQLDGEGAFTPIKCQRAAIEEGARYNVTHKGGRYRWWRSACPVRIANTITGETIDWLTEVPCPHRDVAVCEMDVVL